MRTNRRSGTRAAAFVVAVVGLLTVGALQPAAAASRVIRVTGSAFGYHADNISLGGGSQPDVGPTPLVTLASDASNSPQSASVPSGSVVFGPAVLFTSDTITVSSSGSVGATGSVTSSTSIDNVNMATTQPATTGSEILTADSIASTCTASTSGTTGSVTMTPTTVTYQVRDPGTGYTTFMDVTINSPGGVLQTDSGWDDGDAIYPELAADAGGTDEHDPVYVAIPANPAPNTTYTGHLHPFGGQTDYFTVVINEQSTSRTGVLTVNAVHEYFGTDPAGSSSFLKGDLVLGQSVCGVRVAGR